MKIFTKFLLGIVFCGCNGVTASEDQHKTSRPVWVLGEKFDWNANWQYLSKEQIQRLSLQKLVYGVYKLSADRYYWEDELSKTLEPCELELLEKIQGADLLQESKEEREEKEETSRSYDTKKLASLVYKLQIIDKEIKDFEEEYGNLCCKNPQQEIIFSERLSKQEIEYLTQRSSFPQCCPDIRLCRSISSKLKMFFKENK